MMKPEETPKKNPFLTKHQQKLMKEAEEALTVAEKEEYLKTRKWREASLFGAGPETMTSDDYQTLHDVRRNIWTSGFKGFMMGGIIGAVGSTLYPYLQNPLKLSFIMEPKHRTGAVLGLSALGMLLGASTTGQENSWRMTNIYSRGATPILSRYQKLMAGKALDKEEDDEEGTWGMGIINAARNSRDGTNVATTRTSISANNNNRVDNRRRRGNERSDGLRDDRRDDRRGSL